MRPLVILMVFMWIANILLFFSQLSMNAMAADAGVTAPQVFNYGDSIISDYDTGNYTVTNSIGTELPGTSGTVTIDSGNVFTDTFSAIKNWVTSTTGYKYFKAFITGVPNLLKSMGLPVEMAYSLGAMWYFISVMLVIGFIAGRV